ncbi:MAG: CAP domain-containing protein [Solirubrobacteraceae bacterium]
MAGAAECADSGLVATAANAAQVNDATLCLLNQERATAGTTPLTAEPRLAQISLEYAAQMAAQAFFAHVSPSGQTLRDRFAAASYDFLNAGENLAQATITIATPARIVESWMASPGHRQNILDPHFREVGMGYAIGAATTTFVNEFGTPPAARAAVRTHSTKRNSTRRHRRAARARKASVRHRQGMLVRVVARPRR